MPLVNTLGQNMVMRNYIRKMQTDLARLEEQSATGKISHTFGGLGASSARQVLDKRDMLSRYEKYKESIDFVRSRTGHMDQVLTRVGQTAIDMRDVALKTGYSSSPATVQQQARTAIDDVVNQLNTSIGGIYLFSGVDVNTAPIDSAATLIAAVQGVLTLPDTRANIETAINNFFNVPGNYYNGSATGLKPVRVDDNRTVDYGILPNGTTTPATENGGFAEILSGLCMIALVSPTGVTGGQTEYQQLLVDASQRLNSGAEHVNILDGKNGDLHRLLGNVKDQHEATTLLLEQEVSDLEDVDPYEVVSRLSQMQFQLEASYRATAQLKDLSLVNFL